MAKRAPKTKKYSESSDDYSESSHTFDDESSPEKFPKAIAAKSAPRKILPEKRASLAPSKKINTEHVDRLSSDKKQSQQESKKSSSPKKSQPEQNIFKESSKEILDFKQKPYDPVETSQVLMKFPLSTNFFASSSQSGQPTLFPASPAFPLSQTPATSLTPLSAPTPANTPAPPPAFDFASASQNPTSFKDHSFSAVSTKLSLQPATKTSINTSRSKSFGKAKPMRGKSALAIEETEENQADTKVKIPELSKDLGEVADIEKLVEKNFENRGNFAVFKFSSAGVRHYRREYAGMPLKALKENSLRELNEEWAILKKKYGSSVAYLRFSKEVLDEFKVPSK